MNWDRIIRAVDGVPTSLARLAQKERSRSTDEAAACTALLLLDDAPHAAAALVGAGIAAMGSRGRPIMAALAPHAAPSLASWRSDPDWAARSIGRDAQSILVRYAARLTAALHADPAALRDAVGIVVRDGDADDIDACLAALGAAGWRALDDAARAALLQRALQQGGAVLGSVWSDLTDAQREETAQTSDGWTLNRLIGRIGASAWQATDAALRTRLIDAAAQSPFAIECSAPAWPGMNDAERGRLITAVIDHGDPSFAFLLLFFLDRDGRRALSVAHRAALERQAVRHCGMWRTTLLRGADYGWRSLTADEQALLCDAARRNEHATLHYSPPALWVDLAGGRPLPPAASVPDLATWQWIAADADDDLSRLPPEHQSLVLARAPWRAADCDPSAPRIHRLLSAWDRMTTDARAALTSAHPWMPAVVAAAARLTAQTEPMASIRDAAVALARAGGFSARRTVGRRLAARCRWRPWMHAFAPMDGDPPDVWAAWRTAAQRAAVPDRAVCLSLTAHGVQSANLRRC